MTDDGSYLRRQFETASSLAELNLSGLDTEERGYARFLYAVRR